MNDHFKDLTPDEADLLYKAPALVAILIAGAENVINEEELETAKKIIYYRRISGDIRLFSYYNDVNMQFPDDLMKLEQQYAGDPLLRTRQIAAELSRINDILPKLKREYAIAIYRSLKNFARHVAASSGGFLGFLSISAEEKEWMELKMIKDPREYIAEEPPAGYNFHIDPQYLNSRERRHRS